MANNNCEACEHKRRPDGGHCYMFRFEPAIECMQNTNLTFKAVALRADYGRRVLASVLASTSKKGGTP